MCLAIGVSAQVHIPEITVKAISDETLKQLTEKANKGEAFRLVFNKSATDEDLKTVVRFPEPLH